MRSPALTTSLLLLAAPLLLSGGRPGLPARAARERPLPTEHRLDDDAERRQKGLRKEWIERMHWAAPGVDWRAIERDNGLRLMERRRRVLAAGKSAGVFWNEIGSRNQAGRMHTAALSGAGDSLYAGSSRGGIWKGDLAGRGWRPVSDNLYGGAHALAVAAGPPETITRLTDDGELHYSQDGGLTWLVAAGNLSGITAGRNLLSESGAPDRVYLLVEKSGSGKLYVSEDRGESYTKIRNLPLAKGDIWIDRVNGGAIYLLQGNTMLRSDNQGADWITLGVLPISPPSNVVLAGSEAGAPTLYAAVDVGGWDLYRSTDGGASWEFRYDIGDFWETMDASITDADIVLFGGVELWRSTDGGGAFTKVNGWAEYYGDPENKLHADLPGIDVVWTPQGEEIFYVATDGGLYRSDDAVASVTNISLESLGVSQYYSTHTSVNDPDLILAGAQDQGYQRSTGPAIGTGRDFDQLISGDYGHLTSGNGTHNWVYSVYPGFILVQNGEQDPSLDMLDFPGSESYTVWMPYVLGDPDRNKAFYFCATRIHRYNKTVFNGWVVTPSSQDFTVAGGSFVTALAIAPADHDRRIAVLNNGILWYTVDAGSTWTLSPDTGPTDSYLYGTALEFSGADASTAFVGGSGYSGPAVYRTQDGGASWTPMSSGLPATLVYEMAFEDSASAVIYAATEAGPYRFDPGSETWAYIGGVEAPLTTYWSVEAVPAAGVMRFGTYGRGIWDYEVDALTGVASAAAGSPSARGSGLVNYPNPFNPSTTFAYRVDRTGDVRLSLFDTSGRLVKRLVDGYRAAGDHETRWDGTDINGDPVASGTYIARLQSRDSVRIRRLTLIR